METLLIPIAIYLGIYAIEWIVWHVKKGQISYVSWETLLTFLIGIVVLIYIFNDIVSKKQFLSLNEALPTLLLFGALSAAIYTFHVEHRRICTIGGRVEACISEYYLTIKAVEIVFQQLIYLIIVTELLSLPVDLVYKYLFFVLIVVFLHIPVYLRVSTEKGKFFAVGSLLISVPIFYVFSSFELFWPALYVHALLYVFYGLIFSNLGFVENSVDRGIKDI